MTNELVPCDLCGQDVPGRRHWLMATFVNGAAMYASLCTPCYKRCLAALDAGERAPTPVRRAPGGADAEASE